VQPFGLTRHRMRDGPNPPKLLRNLAVGRRDILATQQIASPTVRRRINTLIASYAASPHRKCAPPRAPSPTASKRPYVHFSLVFDVSRQHATPQIGRHLSPWLSARGEPAAGGEETPGRETGRLCSSPKVRETLLIAVVDEAQDIAVAHVRFFAALGNLRPNALPPVARRRWV
jgi:hypothetical protein